MSRVDANQQAAAAARNFGGTNSDANFRPFDRSRDLTFLRDAANRSTHKLSAALKNAYRICCLTVANRPKEFCNRPYSVLGPLSYDAPLRMRRLGGLGR